MFAHRQSAILLNQNATSTTVAVSLTGVVAGSLIAITVRHEGTPTTITVSDGTTSFTAGGKQDHTNNDMSVQVFYLLASVASGSVTYTATFAATKTYRAIAVSEHSHDGTAALDVASTPNQNAGSASVETGSITTTGTSELIVGSCVAYSSETYTNLKVFGAAADGSTSGGSSTSMAHWWRIFSPTAIGTASATKSSTLAWASIATSFKESAETAITDTYRRKFTRTKQPQTPVGVDRGNPLAQGLSHFWGIRSGANLLDSAGRVTGTLGTTIELKATPHGVVLKATGADNATTNASPVGGTGTAAAATGQTFSMFARVRVGAVYQNNPIFASLDGGVQWRISSVQSLGATATSYAAGSTTTTGTDEWLDVGVSYDGTTVRYYLAGKADGEQAWAYSTFDQTVQHYIGGDVGNTETLSQNSEIAFVGVYKNKILSAEHFKQLADNPWQLFAPLQRILYAPAVAAGGANWLNTGYWHSQAYGNLAR